MEKTSYFFTGFLMVYFALFFSCASDSSTEVEHSIEEVNVSCVLEDIRALCVKGSHQADLVASIHAYEEAYTLFQSLPGTAIHNDAFLNSLFFPLANQWKSIGEYLKSRELFETGLAKLAKTKQDSAILYNQIGLTYKIEGNPTEAIKIFDKGLSFRDISSKTKGLLLSNWIIVQVKNNFPKDSLQKLCNQAINFLKEGDFIDTEAKEYIARIYLTKGQIYLTEGGDIKPVFEEIEHGLAIAEGRVKSQLLLQKSQLLLLLNIKKEYQESLKCANESIKIMIPSFQPVNPEDNPPDKDLIPDNILVEALERKIDVFQKLRENQASEKWENIILNTHEKIYTVQRGQWEIFENDISKQNLQKQIKADKSQSDKSVINGTLLSIERKRI